MMTAEELLKNIHGMVAEYEKQQKSVVNDGTSADMKKLVAKAKNAKFVKHILCGADQIVRDLYCTGLFALFQNEKDAKVRSNAMVFVGRIIASYADNVDLDGYLVKSAKIDAKFWSTFFEFVKGNIEFNFAVDALLMYYLSGKSEVMLKGILDFVEIFGVDKKWLFGLVKAILEQDVDGILKLGNEYFFGYGTNRRLACAKELMRRNKTVILGRWKEINYCDCEPCYAEGRYGKAEKFIEWYILDVKTDRVLLLSKYGVDVRQFAECRGTSNTEEYTDWANSGIRRWLNTFFLEEFEESSNEKIIPMKIETDSHRGNDPIYTEDKVFLLSTVDVEKYLTTQKKLVCKKDIFGNEDYPWKNINSIWRSKFKGWQLRDKCSDYCGYVVNNEGIFKSERLCDSHLIRPAMWVKVDSEIFDL